jgi:hypothetical protein
LDDKFSDLDLLLITLPTRMVLDRRDPYDPYHLKSPAPWVYKSADVKAYFGLELAGIISLPILIVTIYFTKSIQRDKSLYNFFVVLVIAGIVHCITWFTHGFVDVQNPDPPGFKLCLFQAALVTGNSTAQAFSALGLVIKVTIPSMEVFIRRILSDVGHVCLFKVWVTAASLDTQKLAFLDNAWIGWTVSNHPALPSDIDLGR